MNIPTARISVDVSDRRGPVLAVGDQSTHYEETLYMKDEFKTLLGDAQARISVSVDERVSGPPNTYSSVKVGVTVTLSCDQNKGTIDQATELAAGYALSFLDQHIVPATRLLQRHLQGLEET